MRLDQLDERKVEWLDELRTKFTERLQQPLRSDPMWLSVIQYMVSLSENGLDYSISAQSGLTDDRYILKAAYLAKEVNNLESSLSEADILAIWGMISIWYANAVAEMLEYTDTVDERADILGIVLLNWGAFYSRLDLATRNV